VDHAHTLEEVARIESLADWLDEADIEILRCCEGRDRIQFGYPDPMANQLPQARMLTDHDGNGRPDGFIGACLWDTVSVPPLDSCSCCRVWGPTQFTCYGPEVGDNAFSMWIRSADSAVASFALSWDEIDTDWEVLGTGGAMVICPAGWTKIDTSLYSNMLIDIQEAADRVVFPMKFIGQGDTILIARPEFRLAAEAGIGEDRDARTGPVGETTRPTISPNPVHLGSPALIESTGKTHVYDVLGREVLGASGDGIFSVDTSRLGPGIFLVRHTAGGPATKFVVLR
jgi:hypothetical protein